MNLIDFKTNPKFRKRKAHTQQEEITFFLKTNKSNTIVYHVRIIFNV